VAKHNCCVALSYGVWEWREEIGTAGGRFLRIL